MSAEHAIPRGARVAHNARLLVIAVMSFLTLVDLFATQAILPSLAKAYAVSPGSISSAVNACTFGMALAGVLVALFNRHIDRRKGVALSLALLAIPTLCLSLMPDLTLFAGLRVVQGLFMSAAFSLTIAYLAENCSAEEAAGALAAYVAGNVASNLVGRLLSAGIADHLGLSANFTFFAILNLLGAAIAFVALRQTAPMTGAAAPPAAWAPMFAKRELRAAFMIGFIILFAFIGVFSFVNFVLTRDPLRLSSMQLGFVYLVFVPAIIATPFAGRFARRFGANRTVATALAVAGLGLPLLVLPSIAAVLFGLMLAGLGTFFAQGAATGYVSRAAGPYRGAAGGVYLACYYGGGLAGSLILGLVFDRTGWSATVAVIALAIGLGIVLARHLREA